MNCLVHHTLLIPPSLLHSRLLPPSLPPSLPLSLPHLQAGVALVLQQDLNHTHVALVHGHVERRLLAAVPGIEVHPMPGQEVDNVWLIPKASPVPQSDWTTCAAQTCAAAAERHSLGEVRGRG